VVLETPHRRGSGARMLPGVCSSVLDTIGRTPLVRLERLTRGRGGSVLVKLETSNPGLSKKDRIALAILREARRDGSLRPGQSVVELTSGNTGNGLAVCCAVLGHPFVAVMSSGNSRERLQMMLALGAQVELVPQAPGAVRGQVSGADLELVEARAAELAARLGAFRVDQFHRAAGVAAHDLGTASEALEQLAVSGASVDAFVDFVGTGGTFAGCARRLKAHSELIKCYVVEPERAAVLRASLGSPEHGGGKDAKVGVFKSAGHKIQGGGYAMPQLPFVVEAHRLGHVDGFLTVTDDEATAMARRLATEEGILGGFSAGANVAAALRLLDAGLASSVLALVCDSGLKYMSTDLYSGVGAGAPPPPT
jgi:cysteine synthase A